MRHMYRRASYENMQTELAILQNVICSGYFIILDLFFWAFLITAITYQHHASPVTGMLIFTGSYILGILLYLGLRKLLQEPPD